MSNFGGCGFSGGGRETISSQFNCKTVQKALKALALMGSLPRKKRLQVGSDRPSA